MKALLLFTLLLPIPAFSFAQLDTPGLYNEFVVETSGYDFPVGITATFDVASYEFERDSKRLTLFFETGVTNNLAEISIPTNLIGGNMTFYLNDEMVEPVTVHQDEENAFVVLKFSGKGEYRLDITGTTYLPEFGTSFLVLAAALAGSAVLFRYGPIRQVLP